MKHCAHCHVDVTGERQYCPLCRGTLTDGDAPTPSPFPVIQPPSQRHRVFLRLMALVTIAGALICLTVNYLATPDYWWSFFVLAGLASLWFSFGMAIRIRGNIPKNILWQVSILALLAVFMDWRTGFYGWSLDFVIPLLCTCAIAAMAVAGRITNLQLEDYLLYMILNFALGILCVVLLLMGVIKIALPSIICILACVVSLAAIILFAGPSLRAELRKRLHF